MNLGSILRRSAGLEHRSAEYTMGDPAFAEFLGVGTRSSAGQHVTEATAMGLTAFYRSVSLIAGTLAALPWKTYREHRDGTRERADSWLDDPGAVVGMTPYAWRELLYLHLTTWGNWFGQRVPGGAGQVMGMRPLHPGRVTVLVDDKGSKRFRVRFDDGTRELTALEVLHIPALSVDGIRGMAPLTVARNAIGSGLAGDEAAARMFENGALLSGLVSTDEDIPPEDAKTISDGLNLKMTGTRNAGKVVFVNRALKFSPWTQTAEDAQFLESRAFQVEEIARFFGLPKVLLAEDGASTWGSGIAELVRGLEKFTFRPWAARVEAALNTTLDGGKFLELDFAGLLAPSASEVTQNMLAEIQAGTLTVDEARRILNRPPLGVQATTEETA